MKAAKRSRLLHQKTLVAHFVAGLLCAASCSQAAPQQDSCGDALFGSPNDATGLDSNQCRPSCGCGDSTWTAPSYDDATLKQWESLSLLEGPEVLSADPYQATPDIQPDDSTFCGVKLESDGKSYRLKSYASEAAAKEDGARITHRGACGQCSSLGNLAVYIRQPDLSEPVRACGLKGLDGDEAANISCLQDLGFDEPCAQIWYYNTKHTRELCLGVCLAALTAPNHEADGSLNPCIQCDEDESGSVFKAVAGRTRRNSGLPSALCRPCDSVYRLDHAYD
jgi:hypothetical protein